MGEIAPSYAEAAADPQSDQRKAEVIYQVYPASFADSNGDGHGDLCGIISRLDYIKSLGVDAVWISPFFLSPPGAEGDGGYAVTDYRRIDPRFGAMEDFKALLSQAHALSLRIYIDFVIAHTAADHEWFVKSRAGDEVFRDYYVWHYGGRDEHGNRVPPNNWLSVFGGPAWSFDEGRQQWYLHHFLSSQPALNLNMTKVQDAVLGEMAFWFDLGVDGFRIDALPFANYDPLFRNHRWLNEHEPHDHKGWSDQYLEHSICQPQTLDVVRRIRELADSYPGGRTTLGEAIAGPEGGRNSIPVAASYVNSSDGFSMCYTDALMGIWEYPSRQRIADMIAHIERHFPGDGGNCNAASNHDIPRSATRMTSGIDKEHHPAVLRQLLQLFIALPGSFSLYQGEELGLPQARVPEDIPADRLKDAVASTRGIQHGRDGCRTPIPWQADAPNSGFSSAPEPYLPVPESHRPLAVDRQEENPGSMLHFTRNLLVWRKAQPALLRGRASILPSQGNILAFLRISRAQALLCLFNMGGGHERFAVSDHLDTAMLGRLKLAVGLIIELAPYAAVFHGEQPVIPDKPAILVDLEKLPHDLFEPGSEVRGIVPNAVATAWPIPEETQPASRGSAT